MSVVREAVAQHPRATIEILEPEIMLPQVGQGALGIEARTNDLKTIEFLLQRSSFSNLLLPTG